MTGGDPDVHGSLGFGGEESAGASFVRLDGSVWTTDKDGIVPALLAAEITARLERDPGEIYRELTREFGEPVYERVEAAATLEQKAMLERLSPQQVRSKDRAREKIQAILTHAHGNNAPIGGSKVVAESGWFAARPSGNEDIYKIYAQSFQGADHLRSIIEEAQAIVNTTLGQHRIGATNHERTSPCQPPPIQSPTHGNRGVRFPSGTRPGYALVVESRHRRSVAEA